MTEEHTKPAQLNNTRELVIGLLPAILVAVGLVVGVIFTDATAHTATPDRGEQTAAPTPAPTTPAPAAEPTADEAAITATMQRYVDGMNEGDSALFRSALCQSSEFRTEGMTDLPPLQEYLTQIDTVTNVRVSGDTAVALVTASVRDAPQLGSKTTELIFANEDGWKLC